MSVLVALEALMLFVDFVVQVFDEALGLDEELFLGDEHAVMATHVVKVEGEVGRAVVAEQAVLERVGLDLVAGRY